MLLWLNSVTHLLYPEAADEPREKIAGRRTYNPSKTTRTVSSLTLPQRFWFNLRHHVCFRFVFLTGLLCLLAMTTSSGVFCLPLRALDVMNYPCVNPGSLQFWAPHHNPWPRLLSCQIHHPAVLPLPYSPSRAGGLGGGKGVSPTPNSSPLSPPRSQSLRIYSIDSLEGQSVLA